MDWLYDGKSLYQIDENAGAITSYNPRAGDDRALDRNARSLLRWENFLHPERLTEKAGYAMSVVGTMTVEGTPCYELVVVTPGKGAGPEYREETTWLYIAQKDSVPVLQQRLFTNIRGSFGMTNCRCTAINSISSAKSH